MSIHEDTRQEITALLNLAFSPIFIEVVDDSSSHANHAAARQKPQAGHFSVTLKSTRFNGLAPVARHRLVYQELALLMDTKIHALSLNLLSNDE